METFHLFKFLPLELQIMVWKEAYYSLPPQVIEGPYPMVARDGQMVDWMEFWSGYVSDEEEDARNGISRPDDQTPPLLIFPFATTQALPPAILHACQTSRRVALRLGGFTMLWLDVEHSVPRPVWFNFATDIVFLADLTMEPYPSEGKYVSDRNPRTHIQHLAIHWGTFHDELPRDNSVDRYRAHWIDQITYLYLRLPALTDIYCFVPAVRLGLHYHLIYHFWEPLVNFGQPMELRPIKDIPRAHAVSVPPCECPYKPETLEDTLEEMEAVFKSDWMREAMEAQFGERVMANFPPRVHGRVLYRKGVAVDDISDGDGEFNVDIDESLFGDDEMDKGRKRPRRKLHWNDPSDEEEEDGGLDGDVDGGNLGDDEGDGTAAGGP